MTSPAETYEKYMVPTLFAPWAAQLVQRVKPEPGERVLDVACGTGIVARTVAPMVAPGGTVEGLDLSPEMLAVARTTANGTGLQIRWHEGAAEKLPFPEESFDLVLCQFALMFFTNRSTALTEMARVLNESGRLGIAVFQSIDRHPFYVALHQAIERRLGGSGVADIFASGERDKLEALVSDAGFTDVRTEPLSMTANFGEPGSFLAGEIDVDTAAIPAMQHLDANARQNLTASIQDEMEGPLRDVTRGGEVHMPFHVYIVTAKAGR
jgi:ubiquinone/menaquinone biosynthesis C-methylase UbiE